MGIERNAGMASAQKCGENLNRKEMYGIRVIRGAGGVGGRMKKITREISKRDGFES